MHEFHWQSATPGWPAGHTVPGTQSTLKCETDGWMHGCMEMVQLCGSGQQCRRPSVESYPSHEFPLPRAVTGSQEDRTSGFHRQLSSL